MNKNSRKFAWFFAIYIISQVLLAAISFYVSPINAWLKGLTVGELIIGYLTLEMAITSSGLIWILYSESEARHSHEIEFVKSLQHIAHSRWLTWNEFFMFFQAELASYKTKVNVAFMGPVPPTLDIDPRVRRYFEDAKSVIKRRAREPLYYRRIIRLTKANWPWIKQLCEDFEGTKTVSLAVLEDSDDSYRNSLALSVQTVDGERTYLVGITENEAYQPVLALMITSAPICSGFEAYFERLWKRSTTVLAEGRKDIGSLTILETKMTSP